MNKLTKILYGLLVPVLLLVLAANLFARTDIQTQSLSRTEGSVDFQIRTSTYGGEEAPDHVFAIWVTDENDQFVRTLERRAWEYIQDLVKWNDMTGGNYQNAIVTGASMNNHQTHNLTWDCTDNFLNPIPDGVYRIYAEFSEEDTPPNGPWMMVEFTKGPDPVYLTPAAANHFHDIELIYTPETIPDPTIQITSPANNATIASLPFDVEFVVGNFDPTAGDGLIGYLLNGAIIQMYTTLDPITIDDLAEGLNEITLMLYDEFGEPLDPEISAAITVIYEPIDAGDVLIETSRLLGNYPNPFNPSTTIFFDTSNLPESAQIEIYNMKGQIVKTFDITLSEVEGSVTWNGTDDNSKSVSSGVYYYVLKSGGIIDTKKMVLLK
ncbi:DUF2271 domain-containing protein [Candidatus Cloacimonadota bacterium]